MAKQIPLTKGKVAIVDDEDYERLSKYKWHYSGRYARRTIMGFKKISMHQDILGTYNGVADHINGNRLDNRKQNLRVCSHAGNAMNRKVIAKNNTSGYKGVRFEYKKYRASIQYKGKRIHIGLFETAEEAARAYDKKAKELFGEFARTNF